MRPAEPLPDTIRAALRAAADPAKAPAMQRYMKSSMPYYGVPAPALRAIVGPLLAEHRLPDAARWQADIRALWDGATHREERYAAIELVGHRSYRAWRDLDLLPLLTHLIVSGAWWDLVDGLAAHRIGELLLRFPAPMSRTLRAWSVGEDMWLRRTAILSQIRRRTGTDLPLLFAVIEPSIASKEFFLRKAIGWALRELGKSEPEVVRRYVADNEARLSGLSRREALKHLG